MHKLLFFFRCQTSSDLSIATGPFGKTDHIAGRVRLCRNLIGGQFPGKPRVIPIQYNICGPLDNGYMHTLMYVKVCVRPVFDIHSTI